jgi:hypothetical protein
LIVFVDANVPMYLVGADHPNRSRAEALTRLAATAGHELVTSAEVYQEILHRYRAIGRIDLAQSAIDALDDLVAVVLEVSRADIDLALELLRTNANIAARDALHLAVMRRARAERIMTFDRGLLRVPGVTVFSADEAPQT